MDKSDAGHGTNGIDESDAVQLASGIAAFEAKEFRRAWQMLEPLATQNNPDALYRCAIMSQNGLGVVARPEAAAEMMTKAADLAFPLAQHALGVMYVFGEGVDVDIEKAVQLLEMAGQAGLIGAWSTLGLVYNEGRGVAVDKDKAREYYTKAGFDPDEIV